MSSAQNPLTQTPAPTLDWSCDGTPASGDFGDIYFSVDGGLEETKAVFLDGCGLPDAWLKRDRFNVFELGFGSGLNFLACLALWDSTAQPTTRLHFISVEAYPWSRDDLQKALAYFPSLKSYSDQLIQKWPGRVKGAHRLHFGNVSLTLMHMPVGEALASYIGPDIDAWFLDGFSPSKNPDMWSPPVFNRMAELSADGARVGTFTVAGSVRRGLADAGFTVSKQPGFGRKRERLEAQMTKSTARPAATNPTTSPIILGAGIAGASLARAFLKRGITPVVIDKETNLETAASGNPAAMIMPRLDLQDRPESRFFLSAYLYAVRQYQEHGHVLHTSAAHLAKSEDEQIRFEKIDRQRPLPYCDMQLISAADAADFLNIPISHKYKGWLFPNAVTIDPKKTIAGWLTGVTRVHGQAANLEKFDQFWHVYDMEGRKLAHSDQVFVTIGADILGLNVTGHIPVRFTRGQISWGPYETRPAYPVTFGGYALTLEDAILLGATHEHVSAGQTSHTKAADDRVNGEEYSALTGTMPDVQNWKSRASVRVTTKDTLPISTEISDGLFVMTGLGSRGFMMAPLLGEALVSDALGDVSPFGRQTKMRFGTREKI